MSQRWRLASRTISPADLSAQERTVAVTAAVTFPVAITACQRPPQAKQGTYNILNLFIPHKLLLRKPQCLGFRARIRDLLASSNDAAPEGEGFTALEELIDFAKSAMNIQLRAQEYRWAEELQSVCRLEEATYMI